MATDASCYFCCTAPPAGVTRPAQPTESPLADPENLDAVAEVKAPPGQQETKDEILMDGAVRGWEGSADETAQAPPPEPEYKSEPVSAGRSDAASRGAGVGGYRRGMSGISSSGGLKSMKQTLGTLLRAGSFQSGVSSGAASNLSSHKSVKSASEAGINAPHDVLNDRKIIFEETGRRAVDPMDPNLVNGGKPNMVRTAKFTPLTWLPKSLFHQFRRVANVYFLFIAIIVMIGNAQGWSPKDWKSKIGPFVFVLLWSACKDLYEDLRRHRDDRAMNGQVCRRYSSETHKFVEATWDQIKVGDLVYVPEDAAFPADLFLLRSAPGQGAQGAAYISTVMLDGETSLKERVCPAICTAIAQPKDKESQSSLSLGANVIRERAQEALVEFLKVCCESHLAVTAAAPVMSLSDVRGTIEIRKAEGGKKGCPLTEVNLLPRGCVLRSTHWILGVVAYAGDETKVRLNAAPPGAKFSNMQVKLNACVRGLLVIIFTICLYATIMGTLLSDTDYNFLVMLLRFCIALYHVVPMSLYVMYEMLKLLLGFQVGADKNMVDPDTGDAAIARTADLMEELGQVDFIFSDKTGTLTRNEMVFARCYVDGLDPGDFRASSSEREGLERFRKILSNRDDPNFEKVYQFCSCLALCHDVQVRKAEENSEDVASMQYSGMSPDEVALVEGARECGIAFVERSRRMGTSKTDIMIKGPGDSRKKFKVLVSLPFSSDRKRMSVIVQSGSMIWCLTKGADSIMEKLMAEPLPPAVNEHASKFSSQGLRVLCVGIKQIEQEEYTQWEKSYKSAANVLDCTREEQMANLAAKMEMGLTFCGLTAVEDRLQDGVPETIAGLKEAGIRLWVLTGDKIETAVDIARSCELFSADSTVLYATGGTSLETTQELLNNMSSNMSSVNSGGTKEGLVFDGPTLDFALEDPGCRRSLFDLGIRSRAVICARMSPVQKLKVVQLATEQDSSTITAAIGDGANDVPMISAAHVGIAVRGKEGTQAVQASDVCISQFRFLKPLLFVHGRTAYRRVAVFLSYYFYKNMVLLMADFIWMHQDFFGGDIAMPEYLSIGFNAFFTSWHILFVVGFDKDVSDEVALQSPELYKAGPKRELFNGMVFGSWMLLAVYHGSVAWLIPNLWFGGTDNDKKVPSIYWVSSATTFTSVNIIVCLKLILVSSNPISKHTILPTIATLLLYLVCLFMLGYTGMGNSFQPCMEDIPRRIFMNDDWTGNKPIIAIVVSCIAALVLDMGVKVVKRLAA
eukprot:TRINITY_DN28800_c0_g1_i1.p1 TRINITY_DN28800_c0_g1~~TRINITY_DN28800_c0_g1_i1.p1  ORF type:complete len:1249 (-),score=299.85 TRINITY_DN28800_c0_g1_i1:125-3871(-)